MAGEYGRSRLVPQRQEISFNGSSLTAELTSYPTFARKDETGLANVVLPLSYRLPVVELHKDFA
jgi:hypothetical protein